MILVHLLLLLVLFLQRLLALLVHLLLLLNLDTMLLMALPFNFKMALLGVVFLTTVIFPLFFTWILYRMQIISSVFMTRKEERVYPILSISVFYYMTYFLLRGIHISTIFSYFMLGATLVSVIALIVNFSRKISLHTLGAGSVTGLFLGLSLHFGLNLHAEVFMGILLAGIVGFARLKTDSHQPAEIYSGFAVGVAVMTVLVMLI